MLFGVLIILVSVSVVLTGSLYISTHPNLQGDLEQTQAFVRNIQALMVPILVLINAVGILVSVALLVLYTHRIAGPVYSLGRIFHSITTGDLSQEIRFRKGDYLMEVAQGGNAAIEHLRQELAAIKLVVSEMQACLPDNQGIDSLGQEDGRLAGLVQQLSDRLDNFKVD